MGKKMKRILCAALSLTSVCLMAACTSDDGGSSPADEVQKPSTQTLVNKAMADGELSVLTLGNSFSVDAMEYAYEIVTDLGVDNVRIGNLYKPGCSVEQHLRYLQEDMWTVFTYYLCEDGRWTSKANSKSGDALKSYAWDYVVLQHNPDVSGNMSKYAELPALIEEVKKLCPDATIVWNMTWAYQSDSQQTAFNAYDRNQMTMYNKIIEATKEKVYKLEAVEMIIPSGTAIQNARTSSLGDTLTRDGYHLSFDKGRYIAGVVFMAQISGKDPSVLKYAPSGVDDLTRNIAIQSAKKAIANPFNISTVNL